MTVGHLIWERELTARWRGVVLLSLPVAVVMSSP